MTFSEATGHRQQATGAVEDSRLPVACCLFPDTSCLFTIALKQLLPTRLRHIQDRDITTDSGGPTARSRDINAWFALSNCAKFDCSTAARSGNHDSTTTVRSSSGGSSNSRTISAPTRAVVRQ